MCILLIKQDEISRREEELNDLDQERKSGGVLGAVVGIWMERGWTPLTKRSLLRRILLSETNFK